MVTIPIKNYNKGGLIIFIFIVAVILAHLELIEGGLDWPSNYLFPFAAFAINVFYITSTLLIFQTLVDFLEGIVPWSKGVGFRFFVQLGTSMLAYLLIQCIIIYGIEPILNNHKGTPMSILFTFIIGFIVVVLLNLTHLIFYFRQQAERVDTSAAVNPADFLYGVFKNKKVVFPKTSFLAFYIEEGVIFGANQAQQKIVLKDSLSDLEKILNANEYYRINRRQIIAKKAIQNVTYQADGTGIIHLEITKEIYSISRRRMPAFRRWLKN